jgi:hypothetical protein
LSPESEKEGIEQILLNIIWTKRKERTEEASKFRTERKRERFFKDRREMGIGFVVE